MKNTKNTFKKAYQIFASDTSVESQQMTSVIRLFERYVERGDFQKQYDYLFNQKLNFK